jgi:hypothetical protein
MGGAELQLYPPGFVYLGAALHYLALGHLEPSAVYRALVWIAYLAPGLTTFCFLARRLSNAWFALPGGFLALTISSELASGVEGGVRWGMIAARLGWALLPLLALAVARGADSGQAPAAAPPLLAAIVLIHPAHAPAATVLALLAGVPGRGARRRRLADVGRVLVTGGALTAFWTLPLLAHLGEARGLAWGEPAWTILARMVRAGPLLPVLWLLGAIALAVRRDRTAVLVAAAVPVTGAVIALDRSSFLPADRLLDSLVLCSVLAAGLGLGRTLEAVTERLGVAPAAAGVLAVGALTAIALPDPRALALWPRPADWPSLPAIERRLDLPALWAALRASPPGRVLFVRSGVPLAAGTEWYRPHTHVTALAPVYSGRGIINGTFTHPSAIAALVYTGSADRRPIRTLVERLDGVSLFGRPLASLDASTLDRYARFFGVSTVVALAGDRLPALAAEEGWSTTTVSSFVLYERPRATALPETVGPGRWRVAIQGDGAWLSAGVAYSSLWRAEAGGEALATRRGTLGDLEVARRRPGPDQVDLVYGPGPWERAGTVVTGLGLLAWVLGWLGAAGRPRPARPPRPAP